MPLLTARPEGVSWPHARATIEYPDAGAPLAQKPPPSGVPPPSGAPLVLLEDVLFADPVPVPLPELWAEDPVLDSVPEGVLELEQAARTSVKDDARASERFMSVPLRQESW